MTGKPRKRRKTDPREAPVFFDKLPDPLFFGGGGLGFNPKHNPSKIRNTILQEIALISKMSIDLSQLLLDFVGFSVPNSGFFGQISTEIHTMMDFFSSECLRSEVSTFSCLVGNH